MIFAIGVGFLFWGIVHTVWPKSYRGGVTLVDDWLGIRRYFNKMTDLQFTRAIVGPRLIGIGILLMVLHLVRYGLQ